ncbi:hypothetical protein [Paenibacillus sp. yr247]|nr:hypothetical protein [Paenibacillus sp. yr247]
MTLAEGKWQKAAAAEPFIDHSTKLRKDKKPEAHCMFLWFFLVVSLGNF